VQYCKNSGFPDENEIDNYCPAAALLIKFLQCSDCEFGHVSKPSRTQMDGPAPATAKSMQRCKNEDSVQTISIIGLSLR
jgi:hypothetical protein